MDERRYYGLDALRGGMMMLGIVLHAAAMYMVTAPPRFPIVTDANNSVVMDRVVDLIHIFRMPTFFVLAGFFASLLVQKRGLWGTYKNRLARVAGPLLAAMVTVLPLSLVFFLDFMIGAKYGTHEIVPHGEDVERLGRYMTARGVPAGIPLGHLWFLYYLCYFYLLIPLCAWIVERSRPHQEVIGRLLATPWAFVIVSICTAATLWPYPGAQVLGEFVYIKPHWPSLLYYGSFFVLGYFLHFQRGMLRELVASVPRMALLALVLVPLAILASRLDYANTAGGFGPHLLAVLAHGFCTWTLVLLFIGSALRFFDRASPWVLYASQASYWVFLVHAPAVFLVGWWLLPYDLPGLLKFSIVVVVTTVFCFVTYHYWVQRTWVSEFLNGRRFDLDWPWRETKAAFAKL